MRENALSPICFGRAAIVRRAWELEGARIRRASTPGYRNAALRDALRRAWSEATFAVRVARERAEDDARRVATRDALLARFGTVDALRRELIAEEHADKFTASHNARLVELRSALALLPA